MFWLAIHLPQLSLEAFCATLPATQGERPVALVSEHRIHAVNANAAKRGVQPGTKRATALALVSELLLGQADAERDARALLAIAHAALAFTPSVALQRVEVASASADTVLLEVQASLRFFGGSLRLLRSLRAALAPLGHVLSIASAPTALGAELLAQSALPDSQRHASNLQILRERLDPLPVWLLGPAREHWEALQGIGLHQLADLRLMPRAGLSRRFGEALLVELDRALGLVPDAREWLVLPERFSSRLELHSRADTTDQLLHGARILLARLVTWAKARQVRVATFVLLMHHEQRHRQADLPASELTITLAEPSTDAAHLQLLLRERLGRCTLHAPTLEIELRCHQVSEAAPPNAELFPSHQAQSQGLARLLERLRARLGDEQVQWLHLHPDHRPERGTLVASTPPRRGSLCVRPAATGTSEPLPLQRPLWLLDEPLPLTALGTQPLLEGQVLQLLAGPERIETGWWDGSPTTRDYFIAQSRDGSLVWIYRRRLPPTAEHEAEADWMLHGRFA